MSARPIPRLAPVTSATAPSILPDLVSTGTKSSPIDSWSAVGPVVIMLSSLVSRGQQVLVSRATARDGVASDAVRPECKTDDAHRLRSAGVPTKGTRPLRGWHMRHIAAGRAKQ